MEQPQYHMLFPNFTLNIDPAREHVRGRDRPAGPALRGLDEVLLLPRRSPTAGGEMMAFANQVGAEDASLVASVQVGSPPG